MFKNPFSFDGRIRRLEFGLSYIIYIAVLLFIQFLDESFGSSGFFLILFIPVLWFILAQGAKRCHDRGNSGFYLIIPFYILWMLFAESDYGENEYGLNPKGEGNSSEIDDIGNHSEQI